LLQCVLLAACRALLALVLALVLVQVLVRAWALLQRWPASQQGGCWVCSLWQNACLHRLRMQQVLQLAPHVRLLLLQPALEAWRGADVRHAAAASPPPVGLV
jgi:DNA-directed RNA polymerase specialized sigma24 family protein